MIFKMGDVINDEYLVIDSLKYNDKEYVYVKISEDENTILEAFEENGESYIKNIEDDKEFKMLMNKFADSLSKYIEKNE